MVLAVLKTCKIYLGLCRLFPGVLFDIFSLNVRHKDLHQWRESFLNQEENVLQATVTRCFKFSSYYPLVNESRREESLYRRTYRTQFLRWY